MFIYILYISTISQLYPYDFPMRNRGAGSSSALPQSWSDLKGSDLCAPGPGGPKGRYFIGLVQGKIYRKFWQNVWKLWIYPLVYRKLREKMQNVGFFTGNNSYFMGKTGTEHEEYLWLRFSLRNQSNDS